MTPREQQISEAQRHIHMALTQLKVIPLYEGEITSPTIADAIRDLELVIARLSLASKLMRVRDYERTPQE